MFRYSKIDKKNKQCITINYPPIMVFLLPKKVPTKPPSKAVGIPTKPTKIEAAIIKVLEKPTLKSFEE